MSNLQVDNNVGLVNKEYSEPRLYLLEYKDKSLTILSLLGMYTGTYIVPSIVQYKYIVQCSDQTELRRDSTNEL